MKKKLFVTDYDGTLFDHSINDVPMSTLTSLAALEKKFDLVLATGRTPALFPITKEIQRFKHIIAANGQYVRSENTILSNQTLPSAFLNFFLPYMESINIDVGLEAEDEFVLFSHQTHWVDQFHNFWNLSIPRISKDYHLNHPIYQLVIYTSEDNIHDFKNQFQTVDFIRSCPYGFDLNLKDMSKKKGMDVLLHYLDLDYEDVIMIGDGFNDIELLKAAQTSIAMGNASQRVKDSCLYVADLIENDGFYRALIDLKII